jgi:hypothetical protein
VDARELDAKLADSDEHPTTFQAWLPMHVLTLETETPK